MQSEFSRHLSEITNTIKLAINAEIKSLQTRVDSNEQAIVAVQEDLLDLQDIVRDTNNEDRINDPAFIDISTSTLLKEINDRKIKAKNLILYNIPECSESETSACMKHDNESSYNVLSAIHQFEQKKIIKTSRIGRSPQNNKARPLIVSLESETLVSSILRNEPKPQSKDSHEGEVSIRVI